MSIHNRAAQFAPFAALVGYEDAIEESARATDSAIELSSDLAAQLDHKLSELRDILNKASEAPIVNITYFAPDKRKPGGRYETLTAEVTKINDVTHRILLSDGRTISIDDIVNMSITESDAFSVGASFKDSV